MNYYDKQFLLPQFVFWSLNITQCRQISNVIFGAERFGKTAPAPITVEELTRIRTVLKNIHDAKRQGRPVSQEAESTINSQVAKIMAQLTPIFKNVVGTLPNMNNVHKDLFNMLRHSSGLLVEISTWFITLSATDSYWLDLL
jgi:hypothetical protein